jgi:adenylate cyclase
MGGAYVTTDHVDRKLAAILAADMVGYSRLVEADEAGTIARQKAYREELIDPEIAAHKGRIVKTTGDGLLVEFGSVVDAVACAAAWQHAMAEHEGGMPEDRRIQYRIGINLGDIVIDGDDILGDGVNIAARLEGLAAPGGVCISEVVYTSVKGKLDLAYDDLGEQTVKNITQPIRVYRVRPGAGESPATEGVEGGGPVLELPDRPSIAVLPFVNMSGDAEQEYFSDGITEDIITELSRFRSLFVIARNSSFAYKGQSVNIRDIARALGVAYVVEGSVRKAGNRVRITAQLIEAEQGNHVWAERYDRDLEDIFAVQDEVTRSIVSALAGRVEDVGTDRAKRKPTENMTAYDFSLRGKEHFERGTKAECALARPLFEKAVELDPGYARAYSWLGWTHFYDFELGWSDDPDESYARGLSCARRAVEVDQTDAWAHMALAYGYVYGKQYDLCQNHVERASTLNPNDADILSLKGLFLAYLGNPAEGVEASEMARRLNPLAPEWYLWCFGIALYTASRYDDAVSVWREMANPPTEIFACFAAGYAQLGQLDEARARLAEFHERASEELPNYPGDDRAGWRTYWFNSFPYKNAADLDRLLDGLRKAGLPV